MSKISEFADRVNAKYTALTTSLDGIAEDLKALDDKITELQNSQGTITPEDQALLDQIETMSGSLADRVAAIDAQHPVPTEPPPTT